YDPKVGRFLSRDSFAGFADLPLSQNRFSYVHNNPISWIDPSGHKSMMLRGPALRDILGLAVRLARLGLRLWLEGRQTSEEPVATETQPLSGPALARQLSREGEEAAGITSPGRIRLRSELDPRRYRKPDELTATTLVEVKNVAR